MTNENLRDFSGSRIGCPPGKMPGTCAVFEKVLLRRGLFVRGKMAAMKAKTGFFLLTAIVLASTHYLSLEFFLYWRYLWLDIPMHALGGLTAALGFLSIRDFIPKLPPSWSRLLPTLVFTLLVALVWEAFEVLAGIMLDPNYAADTALDLFMGLLGGLVGYAVAGSLQRLFYEKF